MPTSAPIVLFLATPPAFSGSGKADVTAMDRGYAKRDTLSSQVKSAGDAQEDVKNEILGALKWAGQRIIPVVNPLRNQVRYLTHNLNARAQAAIKGEQLGKDMNRSIAEVDTYIQSIEKEPA